MTDEDFLELGAFIEALRDNASFSALAALFETQCVQNILNTSPHEKAKREQAYYTFEGFRSFLGFLATIKERHDELLNPQGLSFDDAQTQD